MKSKLFLGLVAALTILGCGGGGGGVGSGAGTSNAPVTVFASDNLSRDYDQVWVKIHRVELVGAGGAETVFEDAAGKVIDLRKLRDATGARFSFLGQRAIRTGNYSSVRVRLANELTLFPKASSTGQTRLFSATYDVPGVPGQSQISFSETRSIAGSTRLVVDFDLSVWTVDATGRVVAQVKPGDDRGLDDRTRHEFEDYKGTISGLAGTSPNLSFRMGEWSVTTSSQTRFFRETGAANPVLANGNRVEVTGVFVNGTLQATSVKLEDDVAGEDPADLKGLVNGVDAAGGKLTVTLIRARGFVPSGTRYTVETSASTIYLSDAGALLTKDEFFAGVTALGATAQIEAEGTVAATTFSARKLKIEDENERGEAETVGRVTAVDAGAGTLSLSVQSWVGGTFTQGQSLPVVTTASTEYRDGGRTLTKEQFFALAVSGSRVEAKGTFDGVRLTAVRLKPED